MSLYLFLFCSSFLDLLPSAWWRSCRLHLVPFNWI
jgi:hypothetical protein